MQENELLVKYYPDIYIWSFSKTKNKHDAEDLTQDIMIQILNAISKDVVIDKDENYIWKIAYYTWCRRVTRYNKDRNIIGDSNDIIENYQSSDCDISKYIEKEEINKLLNSQVLTLKEKQRNCIIDYYYNDLSVKQISINRNINISLVKYYLYEARKELRRILNDKY